MESCEVPCVDENKEDESDFSIIQLILGILEGEKVNIETNGKGNVDKKLSIIDKMIESINIKNTDKLKSLYEDYKTILEQEGKLMNPCIKINIDLCEILFTINEDD